MPVSHLRNPFFCGLNREKLLDMPRPQAACLKICQQREGGDVGLWVCGCVGTRPKLQLSHWRRAAHEVEETDPGKPIYAKLSNAYDTIPTTVTFTSYKL